MAFFSFGKRVRNQRFNYIPRHYDPAKEDLKDRLRMASEEQGSEVAKMRIRNGLKRRARGNKELESSLRRSSNIRLVIILAIVIAISYVFLTSDAIQNFIIQMSS